MEVGIKRKRGRPRKNEMNSTTHIESAAAATSISSGGGEEEILYKKKISRSCCGGDEMVGRVISGVVEASFEAGYLLNVQLTTNCGADDDDNGCCLRGVVFRADKVCPITITNDVAPHAKMYLRKKMYHHHTCSNSTDQQHIIMQPPPPSPPPIQHKKPSSSCANGEEYLKPSSIGTQAPAANPEEDMQVPPINDSNQLQLQLHPPPQTCTSSCSFEQQADQLLTLFNSSATPNNNLNLELNQPPPPTNFMEQTTTASSSLPQPKLIDIFPTTNEAAAATTTTTSCHHHRPNMIIDDDDDESTSSSVKQINPQLLHQDQRPKLWDPIPMALGPPLTATQDQTHSAPPPAPLTLSIDQHSTFISDFQK